MSGTISSAAISKQVEYVALGVTAAAASKQVEYVALEPIQAVSKQVEYICLMELRPSPLLNVSIGM
jgi:hypothetical protein